MSVTKTPAQTLEILSLLFSINNEMKACSCDFTNCTADIKYIVYIYQFVRGDSEVCGGSFFKLLEKKKCQISLKSLFHRVLQISEPNTALSNVGGWRLHGAGKDHGIAKRIYLPPTTPPTTTPLFFKMQWFLQLTPKKGMKCLQSLFLAKSQKGKRHFKWH